MGKICCMEDTMGLGKFFTNAVTAWEKKKNDSFQKSVVHLNFPFPNPN